MRKFILAALILLVVGVVISLRLIPSEREVVTGRATVGQVEDVSALDVEAEYAKGHRTYAVVNALADKRAAEGKRNESIALLEEYVAANPADVMGHKSLAQHYQAAGNAEGYSKELEAIANAAPTEQNLRALSDIYNANKEYAKQADVLKKLLEVTKGENPQVYVDLATIQLALEDQAGALKTIEDVNTKHKNFQSFALTRLMVVLYSAKGESDRAFQAAMQWMDSPATPALPPMGSAPNASVTPAADSRAAELADLCNILHYSGNAEKAVALVDAHASLLENAPDLVLAYVNASMTAGKSDQAYALLKKMDDAGKMQASLYPPYLELTLKRGDMPAGEAIAAKAEKLNEIQALDMLEVARRYDAASVQSALLQRFSTAEMLNDKPVLGAVVALLTRDKNQDAAIDTALKADLGSVQRLRLAEACARAKKGSCFDAIVKKYPAMEAMTPSEMAEYAQLHILADRAAELVDPMGKYVSAEHPNAVVAQAYHRLAAAAGRMDVLKPWLETQANAVPVAQLQELFYLANDRGHGEVASDIAERLYARDPSPMNRDIIVSAYLRAGEYEKALPLVREQIKQPGTADDGLYLAVLSKLAPKHADVREELTNYANAALKQGSGDDRQQLNYVYILINNGQREAATGYAKANAESRGGEWKKLYTQLTEKPKAGVAAAKLSRAQLLSMAKAPGISAANKRQIAYTLLNDGYKADALPIFMELAADKGPDSQEVKDLLYLWGGKLNSEQLAWVKHRAANATGADQARWNSIVTSGMEDRALLTYVSTTPEALYDPAVRQKYFRVLANTGRARDFDGAMRGWVEQSSEVPALVDYASVAQEFGYRDAAQRAYARVLALDPSNAKALRQKAALDMSKGQFRAADANLNQYIAGPAATETPSESAEAHFYKAQLLRRQGNKAGAAAEFAQVVALTEQAKTAAPDALSRYYTAQFHTGRHAEAKQGFEALLKQFPDNKGLLADYMSVLIEYQYLDDATRIANQYDKTSPYYRKGAQLVGNAANTAAIERLSNGRELKISFASSVADAPPINLAEAEKAPWLEHGTLGYDSVTLSAKPGYVIRYVPTGQEQFAVVASPVQEDLQQANERAQQLRLQLLYARIEQESGQMDKARARVAALKQYYPNDPQLLSYEASLASASGNTQEAMQLVRQAQSAAPENEDFRLQAQNLSRIENSGDSNYAKLDHYYRALGENQEHITTASGVAHVDRAEFGITAQNDALQTDNTRRASDGAIGDYDVSRQRGEFYAAFRVADGVRVKGSLFANNDTLGGGAYLDFMNPLGHTELLGEIQRPYWDFVEAVYEDATRDRAGLTHFATLAPGTTLGFEGSFNNYNISMQNDVAQSILVRLNAVQQLQAQAAGQPYLGVGYGLDGEYLMDTPTYASGSYPLLSVRTREVHALTGIYRNDWTEDTHALFVGGVAYDRINEGFSPLVEGRIDHDLTTNLQIGARARYAQETNNTDNHELDLGADVIYKF